MPSNTVDYMNLFSDFLHWVKNHLDEDALERPVGRDDINMVVNRCEYWIRECDL